MDMMKETEIRPDHLMKAQMDHLLADMRRLIEQKENFVEVSCPACASTSSTKTFEKYELSYVTCLQCETVYVNPRPSAEMLERFYSKSENYEYWNKYIFPATEDARRDKIFRPRLERLLDICHRYQVKTRTLLEVGAGFGTFCEEVQRRKAFQKVIAVEPTPYLAETCRKKGITVIEKAIEQVSFSDEEIDVIASFEVIEHLFCPKDFLLSCAALLKKNGLIIVTCPNVKGFDLVTLGAVSDTVDAEHINFFHPASLSGLLRDCGFDVLESLTPGKLDTELVRKKVLNGFFDLSPQPFLRQILIDEWDRIGNAFQEFLANNQLSSHMWLVGRKR